MSELHIITVLKKILSSTKSTYISFGNIIDQLKDEGLLFMIALISFPTAIPIPTPPGLTTLTGIPLCLLTAQLIFCQEHPWIPKWLSKRQVPVASFQKVIDKSAPFLNKLSLFLKPRYEQFTTKRVEKVVGVLALLCAISIALPILFGNAVPSAGVFIMSIGLLYKDGLAVILGMVISVIGIMVSTAVGLSMLFFGVMAIKKLLPAGLHFLFNHG